jgi:hypothetical protein
MMLGRHFHVRKGSLQLGMPVPLLFGLGWIEWAGLALIEFGSKPSEAS